MSIHPSIRCALLCVALVGATVLGAVPASASPAEPATLAQQDERNIADVLAASPSDMQLAGASASDLVRLAVRCTSLDGLTYCLHKGWTFNGEAAASLDVTADAAPGPNTGDMPLTTALRQWAALPRAERVDRERRELATAGDPYSR